MPDRLTIIVLVVMLTICFCVVDVVCDQIRLRRQERKERRERERVLHGYGDRMDTPDR